MASAWVFNLYEQDVLWVRDGKFPESEAPGRQGEGQGVRGGRLSTPRVGPYEAAGARNEQCFDQWLGFWPKIRVESRYGFSRGLSAPIQGHLGK